MMDKPVVMVVFAAGLCLAACGEALDDPTDWACHSFVEYRLQSESGSPVDEFSVAVTARDIRTPSTFDPRRQLSLRCPSGEIDAEDTIYAECSSGGGFDFRLNTADILESVAYRLTVDAVEGEFDGVPNLGAPQPLTQLRTGSNCLINAFTFPSVVQLTPN